MDKPVIIFKETTELSVRKDLDPPAMTMSESLKKEQQSLLKGEIYRIFSQRSCHKVNFFFI
jgi:hypothetical protein